MVPPMVLEIRLFGALKRFGSNGMLLIEAPDRSSVSEIRNAILHDLQRKFTDSFPESLLERSVLANETRIFSNTEEVVTERSLNLLPPVCGG